MYCQELSPIKLEPNSLPSWKRKKKGKFQNRAVYSDEINMSWDDFFLGKLLLFLKSSGSSLPFAENANLTCIQERKQLIFNLQELTEFNRNCLFCIKISLLIAGYTHIVFLVSVVCFTFIEMSFSLKDPGVLMNTRIHCWQELSLQSKVGGKSNQSQSDKSRIITDKKRMGFFPFLIEMQFHYCIC